MSWPGLPLPLLALPQLRVSCSRATSLQDRPILALQPQRQASMPRRSMCWSRWPPRQLRGARSHCRWISARQQPLRRAPQSRWRPEPALQPSMRRARHAAIGIVVESVATVMSDAASLTAVFTILDFVPSGVAGLVAVPASALASAATVCAAPDCASCERVLVAATEEDALSRGCRLSDAADVSSERAAATADRARLDDRCSRRRPRCCRSTPKNCRAPAIVPLGQTSTARSETTGWRLFLTSR